VTALRRAVAALTIDQWRAIDADSRRDGEARSVGFDWRVLVVLAVTCATLTLQEYVGSRRYFEEFYPFDPRDPDPYWHLWSFAWWSGWRFVGYLVLPGVVVLCMPGERLRDYHLSLHGFFRHLWIYLLLFALVAPAVWIASGTREFQQTYPFYRWANRSAFDLWAWQGLYALQFLSLEFFFRGFMLQGLRRSLGANAIFVMIVPYCMIHFGKPMTETIGSIGAGLILGTLAMRTRSIWGGVAIHVGVATMMDLLAVSHCPTDGRRPCAGN
jgi:membrane protease YdiL (CAAX protease family)